MDRNMEQDEFAEYDGAYVLGALSDEERDAFEGHLATCPQCRARVDELAELPDLLALVAPSAFSAPASEPSDPVIPLLDAIRARRRRRRWIAATAAAVAAACLITITAVIAGQPTKSAPRAQAVAMTALVSAPIHATAEVADVAWGTSIRLQCTYDEATYPSGEWYTLVAVNRAGKSDQLGTWRVVPGKVMTFPAGTAWHKADLQSITIDTQDGTELLQLKF